MTSSIGNNRVLNVLFRRRLPKAISTSWRALNRRGLTFFELLVAVAILAVGITAIYRAFMVALDTRQYLTHRLYAQSLLENRINELAQTFQETGSFQYDPYDVQNIVELDHKFVTFGFQWQITPLNGLNDLYRLDVTLSWPERDRLVSLNRATLLTRVP